MNVYERVTRGILERLQAGVAPWHKPWDPSHGRPRNLVSGRAYNGVNALALGLTGRGPNWLTLNQINALGHRLRQGSRGVAILFVKRDTTQERDASGVEVERERFVSRYYHVFNADDVDGLTIEKTVGEVAAAESIVAGIQPRPVMRSGTQAWYNPVSDELCMPSRDAFESSSAYYGTLFHELTHWTGHASRLNRATLTTSAPFGSPVYSLEELVAEMGAGFLCALAGIDNDTIDQSSAYLGHWLKVLQGDPSLLVRAAAQAQRATDYLRSGAC